MDREVPSSRVDIPDIGPLEAAYADMARAAGLVVSETRLIESARSPGYFATKRFDRRLGGERLHMLSLAAFLDADWTVAALDYCDLLKVVHSATRHEADVLAAFRRMVFNVMALNRDDHLKQHALLMDQAGTWRLAPSFDLSYATGPGNEHYLTVNGPGRDVGLDALASVAKKRYRGAVRDDRR